MIYSADVLPNPLYYPQVGESNWDLRCDLASLQYQGVLPWRWGVLPAIMHIACYSRCRLSITLADWLNTRWFLSLTTLVSSTSLGPCVVRF